MESKLNNAVFAQAGRDQGHVNRAMGFGSFVVAEGTNDKTIKGTGTIAYMINGKYYINANTDNRVITVCTVQAISKRCRYLVQCDASNVFLVSKGTEVRSQSYNVSTIATNPLEKRFTDTAGGFTVFKAGDKISVSGFTYAENNGIFTVEVVDDAGLWMRVRENRMVEEALGDSVTMVVESPLPDLPYGYCPMAYIIVTTGTTTFTMGVDDITDDIGTGSTSIVQLCAMPAE
jgi:hypothetical protein